MDFEKDETLPESETLIAMMLLDNNSLIAVADEQSSKSYTKSETNTKLHLIHDWGGRKVVWGATGGTYPINEIRSKVMEKCKDKKYNVNTVLEMIRKSVNEIKKEKLEQALESKYPKIDLKSIYTGKIDGKDINNDLQDELTQFIKGDSSPLNYVFNGSALLGSFEPEGNKGTRLHKISFYEGFFYHLPPPFEAVGSGYEQAEGVLTPFCRRYTRKGRVNIPHLEGSIAMLQAYNNACQVSQGVGGFPIIHYIRNKNHFSVNDNQAHIASKLVEILAEPKQYFTSNTPLKPWIEALLFEEGTLDQVLEGMLSHAKFKGKKKDQVGVLKFIGDLKED